MKNKFDSRNVGRRTRWLLLMLLFISLQMSAQTNRSISGLVVDESGQAVAGASVSVKNTTTGTITDFDGKYTISAPSDATLVISFLGYTPKEEKVNGRTTINVALKIDETTLQDVVVVGYGTQKKATLTGAVSGVKGTEMRQTKNENPQNMLTGRIAGVRVWQKSAEPGKYNNVFDIRGMGAPLMVIDGIPRTMEEFQRLNPNDIDDISVLKDASAAIYGIRSGNGVVLVTTKKGTNEKAKVSYNGSYTFQKPSGFPTLADPFETMTIFNEKQLNRLDGAGSPIYTENMFEDFRNGTRRTADWTSLVFSDYSPQTSHDLSISGGNDRIQYYVGMGYFYQEGFFKSGDLNYNKYNLRSNITGKLISGLSFDLNLSGIADVRNSPYSNSSTGAAVDIIRNYWRQGVLMPAYADPENTLLSYEGLDLEENTVAKMTSDVSGYMKYKQMYFESSAALNYDFGTVVDVLKGLSAKALLSYDYRLDNNTTFRKEYYQYAWNESTETYNKKLYNNSSPSSLLRQMYTKDQLLWQFLLNYNRSFNKHNVVAMVGWESTKRTGDNFYAQRTLAFPSPYLFNGVDENDTGNMYSGQNDVYELTNSAMIGRLNYNFAGRYLIEAQFRYDGSSKLAKGYQWGFFPSVSAAWRISEEPLFKSISALSFVDQLKVRASYGELGDDSTLLYDWANGYTYPATAGGREWGYYNGYAPGYISGGQYVTGVDPLALPNVAFTWATSRTFDFGIDFEGWNGLFGFTFDYFDRHREGLPVRNTGDLPTIIGATAPRENLDSDRHFGIDLELTHRNRINDFSYRVKAIGTITRQKYLNAFGKGPYANSYNEWRNNNLTNRYQGIVFGYEGAGRYTDWQDIRSYPIYKGPTVLPGDYKYLDWNGDGQINGLDEHPYTYNQTPWMNYSLAFDCNYKNFDLNLLFQGSALGSMQYKEPLYSVWGQMGGGVLTQYLDRWHPSVTANDPYDPNIQWIRGYYGYSGHYPTENSEFNTVSTNYLRLKSVEIGYTLPRIKTLSTMRLRLFANAYNLFTITKVKFVDPEHPDDDLGRLYPLNKTYTIGMSLTF